jgi:hypothetical protein
MLSGNSPHPVSVTANGGLSMAAKHYWNGLACTTDGLTVNALTSIRLRIRLMQSEGNPFDQPRQVIRSSSDKVDILLS